MLRLAAIFLIGVFAVCEMSLTGKSVDRSDHPLIQKSCLNDAPFGQACISVAEWSASDNLNGFEEGPTGPEEILRASLNPHAAYPTGGEPLRFDFLNSKRALENANRSHAPPANKVNEAYGRIDGGKVNRNIAGGDAENEKVAGAEALGPKIANGDRMRFTRWHMPQLSGEIPVACAIPAAASEFCSAN